MPKRYIFTISTGRSGTMLLSKLFRLVPTVYSDHEPRPLFSDFFYRFGNITNDIPAIKRFIELKKQWIDTHIKQDVYIETCHLAGKGFFEVMSAQGWDIEVISLQRTTRDVATSMYRLNDIPGITRSGVRYYLHPRNNGNVIDISSVWERLTHYQLCYWYCLEVGARTQKYIESKKYKVHVIQFSDMLSYPLFKEVVTKMDLPKIYGGHTLFNDFASIKWNYKDKRKLAGNEALAPLEQQTLELEFLDILYRKGKEVL